MTRGLVEGYEWDLIPKEDGRTSMPIPIWKCVMMSRITRIIGFRRDFESKVASRYFDLVVNSGPVDSEIQAACSGYV